MKRSLSVLVLLVISGLACSLTDQLVPVTSPPVPSNVTLDAPSTPIPTLDLQPAQESIATPTLAAANTPAYQVVYVAENDVLNVRSQPGVSNEVIGTIPYNGAGVIVTGSGQITDGALWVPVTYQNISGWTNRNYLTESISADKFCADPEVENLLNKLFVSIAAADGTTLAGLVHPDRGLRLRLYRSSAEVHLTQKQVSAAFTDQTPLDWGTGFASGLPISGSFSEVMLPLLIQHLGTVEKHCDALVHGDTTALTTLPADYQALNYYSFYSPAVTEGGLDWMTVVVGIDYYNGLPFLGTVVLYQWEP